MERISVAIHVFTRSCSHVLKQGSAIAQHLSLIMRLISHRQRQTPLPRLRESSLRTLSPSLPRIDGYTYASIEPRSLADLAADRWGWGAKSPDKISREASVRSRKHSLITEYSDRIDNRRRDARRLPIGLCNREAQRDEFHRGSAGCELAAIDISNDPTRESRASMSRRRCVGARVDWTSRD